MIQYCIQYSYIKTTLNTHETPHILSLWVTACLFLIEENWLDLTRYSKICCIWQHLVPQSSNTNNVTQIFSITEKWYRLEWVWLWLRAILSLWWLTNHQENYRSLQHKSAKIWQNTSPLWWLQDALIIMISTSLTPSTSIIPDEILILTANVWDGMTEEFYPEWHLQRKAWIIHKGQLIHGVGEFFVMARFREIL